ncbi:MAG: hypothetical protein A2847_02365 [Candidatus Sungbacteria bacterium RIFCSPHIGHO2_01_FULL_50_25]|uniref:Uncharacterized protein n=1 Tax=Candidatus Sungbacteria bacterium RIFCSPHIGHO2_01_FULL_50_25 TaxID=1802265 RepID=A0A1G2K9P1_9BACT|nr:MAG: hypothetical protein A2847_02365 [Candidatus Sungbacteria bacterium RIFCSPHIGHO2_01_FULL_50_25]
MKIFIRAKPNAKKEFVVADDATHFIVSIREQPHDGKANNAIIRAISEYLDVQISRIKIISGKTSKKKIIQID